ncbi:MAG: arsenosugar biosynthesis radical SAM protein ArsS [Saprospiraceae bacterium]|nr:arsenosugar biosynthesis radical SAM protein ArsS [Saprospiraceae bacterium]MBP8085905.1 arsenosugar biosynthesis radical SAM protein ArsS [Saprospiraceae bacterium]
MAIRQAGKSLLSRSNPLADSFYQLEVLNANPMLNSELPSFSAKVHEAGHDHLKPTRLEILQINIGKLCNQSCAHCHVDAGPDRGEVMSREILEKCLHFINHYSIPTIDITGGAPELNPHFRWFVAACKKLGVHIIDRCNLTIIVSNPKYYDLPQFFAMHGVHLISSLPHFSKLRTDHQRGDGVFEDSIRALKMLNDVGYGQDGSGLTLDLVHNPSGAFLPSNQTAMEKEFKSQLKRKYGISFNNLYSITNLPISRFLDFLIESGNYNAYMESLIQAFNPTTIDNLMCRNTISVSWDGYLYDCDFNQMLDLKVASAKNHINDFDPHTLSERSIVVNQHCYGCTAGSGSSCGGELI